MTHFAWALTLSTRNSTHFTWNLSYFICNLTYFTCYLTHFTQIWLILPEIWLTLSEIWLTLSEIWQSLLGILLIFPEIWLIFLKIYTSKVWFVLFSIELVQLAINRAIQFQANCAIIKISVLPSSRMRQKLWQWMHLKICATTRVLMENPMEESIHGPPLSNREALHSEANNCYVC